MEDKVLIT